jgi:hypothetical protein
MIEPFNNAPEILPKKPNDQGDKGGKNKKRKNKL